MTRPLEFGFMLQPRSLDETAALAKDAEALGYSWVGVADSPVVYQDAYLHQFEALRATERLRVGPVVSHVVVRHPLIVGNLLATLNEMSGGRVVGTLGTGNSAARGLGMRPATIRSLAEAVECIRGYWRGEGAAFKQSRVPASGVRRQGCDLFIAGDGPRATDLAGRAGDGFLYGGSLEPALVARRIAAGRSKAQQRVWVGPAVSLAEDRDGVLADMGAQIIAMANRALRGDLRERSVPPELHADVHELWRRYDYAFHADGTRPENLKAVSPALAEYVVDSLVVWGDEGRWRRTLSTLAEQGADGVMFILGHDRPREVIAAIADRLRRVGYLRGGASVA